MNKVGKNSITFSEEIGIQQSTLSHILNGRNRPSLDVVMKISQRYPEISLDWLINGQGDMDSDKHDVEMEQERMVNRSSGSYDGSPSYNESSPYGGASSYNGSYVPPSSVDGVATGGSKVRPEMPDLFAQNDEKVASGSQRLISQGGMNHSDMPFPPKEIIKYVEKPCKKITEIIIYYDDNTWEKFTCEK
ncbi:MAG: helix-turn-helix transcriptional regulator [Bacteroidales bacterium]|nr:helix-turn-helix transcriptional regulator [Bacteroidales bacterium]